MEEIKLSSFNTLTPSAVREGGGRRAFSKTALSFIVFVFAFNLVSPQIASAITYQPGETLDPACGPTDPTCIVVAQTSTDIIPAADATFDIGSSTQRFRNAYLSGTLSAATTSTTHLSAETVSIGSLTGFLKAVAGAVSTALVNLASDVTGILPVANGGTGLSSVTNNQLLVGAAGNAVTQIATSSLGISTTDLSEGANLFFTPNRVASIIAGTSTTALLEGNNLYFTSARVAGVIAGTTTDALVQGSINKYYSTLLFASDLAGTSTTALLEGTNLYFTNNRVASVLAGTTTDALTQGSTNKYYSDTSVNSYIHASSTIPKTYTANIFTGGNTFNGGLTVDSLNGPLQSNAGLVSATTSIGVLYGGTGLTSAPSYGQLLLGNSSGGYTMTATSSLGFGGSSGTVISVALTAPTGLTVTGSPITTSGTLALSLTSGYNIPLTASTTEYDNAYSNRITSATSPLSILNHLVSLSTAGDWTGTFDNQEGSYYLNANNLTNFGVPFYTFFSATTTDALAQGVTNKYYSTNLFAGSLAGTTTTALAEGNNLYFTNARADARINATSTIGTLSSAPSLGTVSTSLTGFLKATAGVLSTALVNLASNVTGILPVGNGGTGWANVAGGALVYGNGSSALATTSTGVAGQVLTYLNGVPTWTATSTLSTITGTLPATRGGTGVDSSALTGVGVINAGTWSASSTLATNVGGTGATSFTQNGVLYGNTNSAIQVTAQGAANTILVANAGAPSFSSSPTIGTSITAPLHVGGTSATSTLRLKSTSGAGTSDAIVFQVGNNGATEAARITTSGFFGVATTSPWRPFSVSGKVAFASAGLTAGIGSGSLCLTTGGDVTYNAGSNSCQSSSRRFKHNVVTSTAGLDEVLKFRPITYEYNADQHIPGTRIGFIAEEVAAIDPLLAHYDSSGVPDSVEYDKFSAVLVRALQDLVHALRDTVQAATGMFDKLLAKELVAKNIQTDELCIKNVCITSDQLAALIATIGRVERPSRPDRRDASPAESSTQTQDSTSSDPAILDPLPTPQASESTTTAPIIAPPVPSEIAPVSENGTI